MPASKFLDLYEEVPTVPEGLRWAPWRGAPGDNTTTLYSMFGKQYKLVRNRTTGDVRYYKLKDEGPAKSPPEIEPVKPQQVRYRVGTLAWFIDVGERWYCVEIVKRTGGDRKTWGEPKTIAIHPTTGWDADRIAEWSHGDVLEFPAYPTNRLFQRLRPLSARAR